MRRQRNPSPKGETMTTLLERPRYRTLLPVPQQWKAVNLPRTKEGVIKSRLSWEEKLRILDPTSPKEIIKARLDEFAELFAHRYTDGIITRVGQGPRAWIKLRGAIAHWQIVRHLLAGRVPTLPPQWIGARSFRTTRFFAIDIDCDRTPEQIVADSYDLSGMGDDEREHYRSWLLDRTKPTNAKPSFEDRCRLVEQVLRRLGINPSDPMQVLIQPTPSGGRHYFVFLDASYFVDDAHAILKQAGLKHTPGQHEFFPSTGRGLRLPFGHVPGQTHDPRGWIRFVDAYRFKRFRRFSLKEMADAIDRRRLAAHTTRKQTRRQPRTINVSVQEQVPRHGVPKRERQPIDRYRQLVHQGPQSIAEAQELMELGIRFPHTRTEALKHVAAHLVWFRGQSAEEATERLTTWAYDHRHDSKDIRADLQKNTRKVAKQIVTMCAWYAAHKKSRSSNDRPVFANSELMSLRPHFQTLPSEERTKQAHFLLSFLRFAKAHGKPAQDRSGWEAAPAINAVVKKWEGCRHGNDYRRRIDHAEAAGILTMTLEKWQNHRGPGRARTYRLAIPVVPREEWSLDYDTALNLLTRECPPEMQQVKHDEEVQSNNATNCDKRDNYDERTSTNSTTDTDGRSDHPAVVHPPRPGTHLEPGARECHQEPNAAVGLPRQADGGVPAVPAAATPKPCSPRRGRQDEGRRLHKLSVSCNFPERGSDRQLPPNSEQLSFEEKEQLMMGLDKEEGGPYAFRLSGRGGARVANRPRIFSTRSGPSPRSRSPDVRHRILSPDHPGHSPAADSCIHYFLNPVASGIDS
jgi:hypothetical protein